MKKILSVIAMGLALSMGAAHAADAPAGKQQGKMATCSADFKATGKDGKERQGFMKECLSNKPAAAKPQGKMATCSADFKTTGKDGKERQAFMKECLKK